MQGCVRQVALLNPSGASDKDIMFRAKMILSHQNYEKLFKFEHVPPMLKDVKKFGDEVNTARVTYHGKNVVKIASSWPASSSEDRTSTHSTSSEFSSFSLNINEDNIDDTSTQRSIGVKKGKLKRKNEDEGIKLLESIKEENR
ncbi:unnamed protein product [Fraxinus pennsylvanica]|uniref:No apical meristem-associated C-terminal domain-containing protein n=1 Tax=Fraxinus pennsylvanica TaxID=56036 RepID=A0AAD2E8H1_9LAMI|nr:unnamed protein product [Fraxinus pennsylvanica]